MKNLNFGIIAHVDSGKTTLSEAMLYISRTIRNFGRVDKGESFLDGGSIERRRGITITSKQARFTFGNTSFTLLDTPGHSDFSAEMERTLQVMDYCVLLISASDGITGQTQTLWKLLAEYDIPTFVFFNKMDQDGADRMGLLLEARAHLSDMIVDFDGKHDNAFYDRIAMCSEEAMDFFLENDFVPEEMINGLIADRKLFPAYFGSALNLEGVENLLTDLDRRTLEPDYPGEFGARVYKIMRDDSGSRLTLMKITGGSLKTRDLVQDGDEKAKVNQIRLYSGDKYTTVSEAAAGEICALEGLHNTYAGEGLGIEKGTVIPVLMPVLCYRVLTGPEVDNSRVLPFFKTVEEENPELSIRWDEESRQIYVCVMGEVQLEILTETMKTRFGLDISYDTGDVIYAETITEPTVGVGHFEPLRHYAEVHLLMEPLPAGSGLEFASEVSTDELARNWQRLILTHLAEREHRGVLTGAPITDMKITLTGGRAHIKHTEGGDFRQATYRAVRQGLMMGHSRLLEPYYSFVLKLPTENVGRAMTDLGAMEAVFGAPDTDADMNVSMISGRVPVEAFKDYPKTLAAYTQGRGSIALTPDGYGPCHNEMEVIERREYNPVNDIRNTPDSVFCAHGAGFVVPCEEVYGMMHVPFNAVEAETVNKLLGTGYTAGEDMGPEGMALAADLRRDRTQDTQMWLGTDEIDSIIAGISRAGASNRVGRPGWKRKKSRTADTSGNGSTKIRGSEGRTKVFEATEAEYTLVDGYNVIFAWEDLNRMAQQNIDAARDALVELLCNYQGMIGSEVIAVFDAYRVKGHDTEYSDFKNIHIVYTKEAETADQYIEKFANGNAKKYRVTVITSDGLEQIIIRGEGCSLISSREFESRYRQMKQAFNEEHGVM